MKSKWYVLTLSALVNSLTFGIVYSGLSVLFPEIAEDLSLSYAQVGLIWGGIPIGMASLTFVAGMLGDRFGARLTIGLACFLAAISHLLRGTASNFILLATYMIMFGICNAAGQANLPKTIVTWFEGKSLGLISGILGVGFCVGAAISTMVSATFFSPLMGGWRGVMYLYAIIAAILGTVWLLTIRNYPTASDTTTPSLRKKIATVIRSSDLWFDGIAFFIVFFSISGIAGYLPIYFETVKGMTTTQASNLVSLFIWVSVIGSLAIPLLSDRLGRKFVYIPTVIITGVCILLVPTMSGIPLTLVIIGAGLFGYGGAFLMHYVVVAESRGVTTESYGAAFGMVLTLGSIGGFTGPTVGGIVADINPNLPFTIWATALVISLIAFSLIKGSKITK